MLIKNGTVFDFANGVRGERLDILVRDGIISALGKNIAGAGDEILDAKGLFVVPGLVDLHVHLREPGQQHKETIETGTASAAKGGVTTVLAMPNTNPPVDSPAVIGQLLGEIKNRAKINVLVASSMTGARKGQNAVDFAANLAAGCAAFSDDGSGIQDPVVMTEICEAAVKTGALLVEHPELDFLSNKAPVGKGRLEKLFKLPGQPAEAESLAILMFGNVAGIRGARIHFTHISTEQSVKAVALLKERYGKLITCDCTPHHIALSDRDIRSVEDTNKKINPPLRPESDRKAIVRGLKTGTIDAVATDHAPHTAEEKKGGFEKALPGSVGLETFLPVTYTTLVAKKEIGMMEWVRLVSLNPSNILGIKKGSLGKGDAAGITLFDPNADFFVEEKNIVSKSKNSAFLGRKYKGVPVVTICGGRTVYNLF